MKFFIRNKLSSPIIQEMALYGVVGLSALIVQDICYIIITSVRSYPIIAMFIGNILGMFISYIGHNKFTFKKQKKCYKEFMKFSITSGVGLSFNLMGTYLLVHLLGFNHNFGLIPTVIAPAITYTISKFWVFK